MKNKRHKPILIAGPCAAESEEQIRESIVEAKKRQVDFLRINLWKPRTKPGFDGLGKAGLRLLTLAAQEGINPGLEVVLPEHAKMAMDAVLHVNKKVKLLIWIGARNQNHMIQQEIARIASQDDRVYLMLKNQPWFSEEHWIGIAEHALMGGIKRENILMCHRGFAPHNEENPLGLRNIPDFPMSMTVKNNMAIPVIFDPSHSGGTVPNVMELSRQSAAYQFDGIVVEVHPNPPMAKTDVKQQLTWAEFDKLLSLAKMKKI